ncbi:MAG: nuclear transport factor 2 family protein [Cyanobacteriota bacterium]
MRSLKKILILPVIIFVVIFSSIYVVNAQRGLFRITDKVTVTVPVFKNASQQGAFEGFMTLLRYSIEDNIGEYVAVISRNKDVYFIKSGKDIINFGPDTVRASMKGDMGNYELLKAHFSNIQMDIKKDIAWLYSDCNCMISINGEQQEFSALQRTLFVEYNGKWYVVNTRFYEPGSQWLYKPMAGDYPSNN